MKKIQRNEESKILRCRSKVSYGAVDAWIHATEKVKSYGAAWVHFKFDQD